MLRSDAEAGITAAITAEKLGTTVGSVRCARHEHMALLKGIAKPAVSPEALAMREKLRRSAISESIQRYHKRRRAGLEARGGEDALAEALMAKVERIAVLKRWEARQA